MNNAKIIKETLQEIIANLEIQRTNLNFIIDDMEVRIKKNKAAGNIVELDNLSPDEKGELQKLIKQHITENTEDTSSKNELTTAKQLMPKMKDKV